MIEILSRTRIILINMSQNTKYVTKTCKQVLILKFLYDHQYEMYNNGNYCLVCTILTAYTNLIISDTPFETLKNLCLILGYKSPMNSHEPAWMKTQMNLLE